MTDRSTNNRADCLSAQTAVDIASKLDPSGTKRLVINTRYQGLVFSMAGRAGKARWVDRWQHHGWLNSKRELVANHDVFKTLVAAEKHRARVTWNFVDKCKSPEWMLGLHQEAERLARRYLSE